MPQDSLRSRGCLWWAAGLDLIGQSPESDWPGSPPSERTGPTERGREEVREREEIETDRDSFTPPVTTAGSGSDDFESAYSFLDNRGLKETHSFPGVASAVRHRGLDGSASGLELRSRRSKQRNLQRRWRRGRLLLPKQGRARDQSLLRPEVPTDEAMRMRPRGSAILLQGVTPTSGNSTDTQFIGAYVFGWELPNRWKLDAALRYATGSEEADRFNTWAPSIVLKAPVGERINVHAEYFGIFSRDKAENFTQHFVSPGVHYLISPDVEVGVRLGWDLNDQSARFFANAGLGLRF